MKNLKTLSICLIFVSVISIFLFNTSKTISVNAQKDVYAKIINKSCVLYDENQQPILILPESYYVLVLDELDLFYYVKYKNVYGYVSVDDVKLSTTPKKPFQDDFVFYALEDTFLCSKPNLNSKIVSITPSQKLYYLGNLTGQMVDNLKGNVWYYCYSVINGEIVFGYVYSPFTSGISGMIKNTEKTSLITSKYQEIKNMPKSTFVLIVILTFIPMLFVLYLLFTSKVKIYTKEDFF